MIKSSYFWTSIVGAAAALMMSGCVSDGDGMDLTAGKPVIFPAPVNFETKSSPALGDVAAAGPETLSAPRLDMQANAR